MRARFHSQDQHFFFGFFAGCSYLMILALGPDGGDYLDIHLAFSSVITLFCLVISHLVRPFFRLPRVQHYWNRSQVPALSLVMVPILMVVIIPRFIDIGSTSSHTLALIFASAGLLSVMVGSYHLPSPIREAPNKATMPTRSRYEST